MKEIIKKPWFIGSAILTGIVLVYIFSYLLLILGLDSPYENQNIWSLAENLRQGEVVNYIALLIKVAFFAFLIPMFILINSMIRKRKWKLDAAIIYLLVFQILLIFYHSIYQVFLGFSITLIIINILLLIGTYLLKLLKFKNIPQTIDQKEGKVFTNKNIPLYVLLIEIGTILVFLITFLIPLYSLTEVDEPYKAVIINVLAKGDTNIITMIYFFVNFIYLLLISFYFANTLSNYFFDKEKFIKQSKTLINLAFAGTLTFFMVGLAINIYYTLEGDLVDTVSYIPLLLTFVIVFTYAVFRGRFGLYYQTIKSEVTKNYPKIESLLFVILMTAITFMMLFLPILKIDISSNAYEDSISMTGFDILRDYSQLDEGYRMLAFILIVLLISIGLGLVLVISSYLSKYTKFKSIVKSVTFMNVFFVFIVGISGYYFQIAKEINRALIFDIFSFYGIDLSTVITYEYSISTQAIYALIVSIIVLVIMFTRKVFEEDQVETLELKPITIETESSSNHLEPDHSPVLSDDVFEEFDPCPAFTEIDKQVDDFKKDYQTRNKNKVNNPTLNGLVHFIVDYAKNSRLHLSYSYENIATFIAGLGSSKLSILQGMSGTGKTSLPKIFAEAINGNCEIVEVESSWKDKNELLGYYNEFSMKYTPKKFTLALYKAALNQEIFTFILLDEMNLSRIEYYFSDFLSLMENEEGQREIKLVNIQLARKEEDGESEYLGLERGHTLKVPSNVWFIGTANRDESTFVISDKVYDRAHTMNFMGRAPKVRNYTAPIDKQFYDYKTIHNLLVEAKKYGDFDAENNSIIKAVESILAPYNISFGNRILNQIEDFVNIYKACFEHEDVEKEAVEKILLSKVVAKLELKVIDDKEKLEYEFEKLNLHQCVEFIKTLDNE